MSKNLEREYRALVNSEVPDLWARIEAGLEDQKTAPEESTPEQKETDLNITDFPKTDSQMENMCGRKVNFKMWAGLAAACVCVVLIVPALARTMIMGGEGSSYSNPAPSYTPQDDTPQAAGSYEKAEDAGLEEVAAENTADNNGTGSSAVTSDNTNAAVDFNVDTIHFASGELEEAAEAGQELYIFHATVEILDIDISMDGNVLYTAKVITSEKTDMQADNEIKIIGSAVAAESEVMLENSKTYDLMLCEEYSGDSSQERTYILINDAVE